MDLTIKRIEEIQRTLLSVKVEVSEAPKIIGCVNELDNIKTHLAKEVE